MATTIFYREQSQGVENLEKKHLDGRQMLKSGRDLPEPHVLTINREAWQKLVREINDQQRLRKKKFNEKPKRSTLTRSTLEKTRIRFQPFEKTRIRFQHSRRLGSGSNPRENSDPVPTLEKTRIRFQPSRRLGFGSNLREDSDPVPTLEKTRIRFQPSKKLGSGSNPRENPYPLPTLQKKATRFGPQKK